MSGATAGPALRPSPGGRPEPRRRPGPLIVLGLIAVVPALALLAVYRWSDARVDAGQAVPSPPTTILAPPPADPPLSTELFTLRRVPTIVSRDLNIAEFQRELLPFLGSVNDRSCVAVSVDGVPIGSQHSDLAVIPASNMKLAVAGVALDVLGPTFRYTTEVTVGLAARRRGRRWRPVPGRGR